MNYPRVDDSKMFHLFGDRRLRPPEDRQSSITVASLRSLRSLRLRDETQLRCLGLVFGRAGGAKKGTRHPLLGEYGFGILSAKLIRGVCP